MLNSIGLDNDGLEAFIANLLPYLAGLGTKIIVSIAGKSLPEFIDMAARLDGLPGVDALELNISCPNVSGGVDFGTDPAMCEAVVSGVRKVTSVPVIAKLTPNVTDIAAIARAAEAGGSDALAVINTCLGMAINWRRRRSQLGRMMGGLSGPAIKPIALRAVYQAAQAVKIPIVGIGGIATIDDAMDFLVAGATAVQVGTANFYNPVRVYPDTRRPAGALREAGADRSARLWERWRVDRPPYYRFLTAPHTNPIITSCHAYSPASNRPADSTGAITSARSASTSTCRTGPKPRFTSSPTCTP